MLFLDILSVFYAKFNANAYGNNRKILHEKYLPTLVGLQGDQLQSLIQVEPINVKGQTVFVFI